MSSELIDPNGIPQFTGDLEQLERDATDLSMEASLFRLSGGQVHSTFQGLSAFYEAPEAEDLFATTKPVATRSDAFAGQLEKVAQALSDYASEVRPLAKKLKQLQIEASAFVIDDVSTDDEWRKDQGKVDHNNRLVDDVKAAAQAFRAAETACHNTITKLVDGIQLKPSSDGSTSCGTYGYTDEVLDQAEELPWGAKAERDYDGVDWFVHQAKEVGKGFFVDGVVGTAKALGTLAGKDGWGAAGEAWTNLAKLSTGLTLTMTPLGGAFWMAKDDQLPGWLRDSRQAVVATGKGLIAYDQWSRNPARAGGLVGFNAVTIVATRGAGAAAKGGAMAKVVSATGRVGRAVDPFTYAAKGVKFATVKVGDLVAPLKNSRPGAYADMAENGFRLPERGADVPVRPAAVPDNALRYVDGKGRSVYLTKEGAVLDGNGKVLQKAEDARPEPSAADRAAPVAKEEAPPALRAPDRQPVLAGGHAGEGVAGAAGRVGDDLQAGGRPPGGRAHEAGHGPSAHHEPPAGPPRDGSSSGAGHGSSGGHHGPDGAHHSGESPPNGHPGNGHTADSSSTGHDIPGHADAPHSSGNSVGHSPGSGPSGPLQLGGDAEHRLREAIKGIPKNTMKPKVLERAISRLAEHPYGREVAEVISSGKFSHATGFRDLVSQLGSGVAGQHIRAIDQIRFGDQLHASGLRNIEFEIKNSAHKADLDVKVTDDAGNSYGYQMKRFNNPKDPFEQIARADYLGQLSKSQADVRVMLVDGQGTVADWTSRGIPDELLRVHRGEHALKSEKGRGILFVLRLDDGTIVIPPGAKVDPRGVL